MTVTIEIGIGELMDRYTILKIKMSEIKDPQKLSNVQKEYEYLSEHILKLEEKEGIQELVNELFEINEELWDIEDELRQMEASQIFDEEFVETARMVYKMNDQRAAVKKKINLLYNSAFVEEKSYK